MKKLELYLYYSFTSSSTSTSYTSYTFLPNKKYNFPNWLLPTESISPPNYPHNIPSHPSNPSLAYLQPDPYSSDLKNYPFLITIKTAVQIQRNNIITCTLSSNHV